MGGGVRFKLEFYRDESGREVVREWLRGLSQSKRMVLGQAMREVLQHLGVEVCGTEFGRQLGQGLFEFRFRQKPGDVLPARGRQRTLPTENTLLRVFCHAHGERLVLLLGGYDKGGDPSHKRQQREIAIARTRLVRWRTRQRLATHAGRG